MFQKLKSFVSGSVSIFIYFFHNFAFGVINTMCVNIFTVFFGDRKNLLQKVVGGGFEGTLTTRAWVITFRDLLIFGERD